MLFDDSETNISIRHTLSYLILYPPLLGDSLILPLLAIMLYITLCAQMYGMFK